MSQSTLALLALGFGLGLRHALDVDHLAAVAAIATRERGVRRSGAVGALWGLGHGASLLAVAVVVLSLRTEIPPDVTRALELGVAAMLIGIGARFLWSLWRGSLHHHEHAHGGVVHSHPHAHGHDHAGATHPHAHPAQAVHLAQAARGAHASDAPAGHHEIAGAHRPSAGRQPLLVGMLHGLAGSGALMLAVLATVPSTAAGIAYVLVFALGSIAGMAGLSALVGLPFRVLGARAEGVLRALEGAAAAASIAVGVALGMGA